MNRKSLFKVGYLMMLLSGAIAIVEFLRYVRNEVGVVWQVGGLFLAGLLLCTIAMDFSQYGGDDEHGT